MRVKHWVASITASLDDFVNKVENHEAVAESVIADVRKAAARLRAQRARLEAELTRHRAAAQQAQENTQAWQQRALALPVEQEAQALECIARAEQESERAALAQQQIKQGEALVLDISHALADVESQLQQLKLKKTTLSSRNTRANVLAAGQDFGACNEVDSVFERWEQSVIEKEYADTGPIGPGVDEFEQPFVQAERQATLKSRLDTLRQEQEQ